MNSKASLIEDIIKNITTPYLNRKILTKINKNKVFYAAQQADKNIKIVLPFVFKRDDLTNLNKNGLEGSTARIIEYIKGEMKKKKFPE